MMSTTIVAVLMTACCTGIGYFIKNKFDKVDRLCRTISRLEKALLRIPCVSQFLEKEDK